RLLDAVNGAGGRHVAGEEYLGCALSLHTQDSKAKQRCSQRAAPLQHLRGPFHCSLLEAACGAACARSAGACTTAWICSSTSRTTSKSGNRVESGCSWRAAALARASAPS